MTNFGDFRLTVFGQFNPTLTLFMRFIISAFICRITRKKDGQNRLVFVRIMNMRKSISKRNQRRQEDAEILIRKEIIFI